jgi:16S rRNA (uracil1498-N3)-methyltransferase
LEQCVELGITRCIPFVAQRAHHKTYPPGFLTRLRKIALAAMKQSFRSFLPEIDDPVSLDELLLAGEAVHRFVVGGQGDPPVQPRSAGESVLAVVGPEPGFTDQERTALVDAGATFASVSSARLRSETAAVALVAALGRPD